MKNIEKTLLGAHMSIAGGFDKAIDRGVSIGCNTIQIFTHSNRQWHMKPLSQEECTNFFLAEKTTGLNNVVTHASYLINLGSESLITLKKSITTLEKELIICEALKIKHCVLHPGSGSSNKEKTMKQIAESINEVFSKNNSSTIICLEIMAGQGNWVGSNFEELAYIISLIKNKKRMAVCFDTCHAWAAGYNFSNEDCYEKMWKDFNNIIGLEKLKVIHLNDSKKGCGSRVDRHANIGQGTMGIECFKLLMNDKRFFSVPKILETPDKKLDAYLKNLTLLKKLMIKK